MCTKDAIRIAHTHTHTCDSCECHCDHNNVRIMSVETVAEFCQQPAGSQHRDINRERTPVSAILKAINYIFFLG